MSFSGISYLLVTWLEMNAVETEWKRVALDWPRGSYNVPIFTKVKMKVTKIVIRNTVVIVESL